jgi:hypothetical protein
VRLVVQALQEEHRIARLSMKGSRPGHVETVRGIAVRPLGDAHQRHVRDAQVPPVHPSPPPTAPRRRRPAPGRASFPVCRSGSSRTSRENRRAQDGAHHGEIVATGGHVVVQVELPVSVLDEPLGLATIMPPMADGLDVAVVVHLDAARGGQVEQVGHAFQQRALRRALRQARPSASRALVSAWSTRVFLVPR